MVGNRASKYEEPGVLRFYPVFGHTLHFVRIFAARPSNVPARQLQTVGRIRRSRKTDEKHHGPMHLSKY